MKVDKGDFFKAGKDRRHYQAVGKWGGDIVLAPLAKDDEDILIYTPGEIDELLESGWLEWNSGWEYDENGRIR